MSRPVTFKPAARPEFVEAIAWHEKQRPGLGREFVLEVESALQHAQVNPEHFPKVRQQARKIRLQRFSSYSIYFAVKDGAFSILAVFHGSRNPEELWQRMR
jgi:plasmid stabilization system protein ParE